MSDIDLSPHIDGGEDAREATSLRWRAIEAPTYTPELSPTARRVGIALICSMDTKTRACFPSETRLAALCDLHISAVRKAKAELRKAGLIDWENPGGPRHLSHYGFDWTEFEFRAAAAKRRADEAIENRRYRPSNFRRSQSQHSHAGIIETVQHTHVGINGEPSPQSKPTRLASQPTQMERPTYPHGASNLPARVLELSQEPPTITSQIEHDARCASADATRASAPDDLPELPLALDRRRTRSNIWEVLKDRDELLNALVETGQEEEEAIAVLNRDCAKAAITFVAGLISQGTAA